MCCMWEINGTLVGSRYWWQCVHCPWRVARVAGFRSTVKPAGELLARATRSRTVPGSFAEGFINATLFTCVGAMAIVGSLQSGLSGNHETLLAKALIDGCDGCHGVYAGVSGYPCSSFGILYESLLTLSARRLPGT